MDGSGLTVYLVSGCAKVEVDGTNNKVIAEGLARVELSSINHQVSYLCGLGGRAKPGVELNGFGHRVVAREVASPAGTARPTSPAPRPASAFAPTLPVLQAPARSRSTASGIPGLGVASALLGGGSGMLQINADGVPRELACGGRMVQVNGFESEVVLSGDCPTVQDNGDSNEVWIQRVDQALLQGDRNRVFDVTAVTARRPRSSDTGDGNTLWSTSIEEFEAR